MQEVLARLKVTGQYTEGVGPERIAWFERELHKLQQATAQRA
jgi:hypothetical protein